MHGSASGHLGTAALGPDRPCNFHRRSPKHSRPDVNVTYCGRSGYWLVDIKCKDRAKLLFDTVMRAPLLASTCRLDIVWRDVLARQGLSTLPPFFAVHDRCLRGT